MEQKYGEKYSAALIQVPENNYSPDGAGPTQQGDILSYLCFFRMLKFQDSADSEFAVTKMAISRYRKMSREDDPSFINVEDSASVVKYGNVHLREPKSSSEVISSIISTLQGVDINNYLFDRW